MIKTQTLHNLKVLITRPLHQAKNLCEQINALGGEAILFPTLEIVDLEDQSALFNAMSQLIHYDIAIFVSINAVFKVMPHWPKTTLPLRIAAIGPATSQALSKFNLETHIMPLDSHNSEGLLRHPQLLQCQAKHIVIFSGFGGRNLLADTLQQRGALITKVPVYQRVLPRVDMREWLKKYPLRSLDIVVSTSNESLENLVYLLNEQRDELFHLPLLVISQRMSDYATKLGFMEKIWVAPSPSDEAILHGLKAWYASQTDFE